MLRFLVLSKKPETWRNFRDFYILAEAVCSNEID